MNALRFYAGVFIVTSSTLMLQLVQTRILSVVLWYHLAFFVISIAMFGLTAGAVWVYSKGERFTAETLSHDLSYFTAAFALATALSLTVQMTLAPELQGSATFLVVWAEFAICIALPFFFSGVIISLALTRSPYPIGRVYGVDLVGAAAGCLGALLLLDLTDGPSAILWVAVWAAMGAFFFSKTGIGARPEGRVPLAALLNRPVAILLVLVVCAAGNGMTRRGIVPLRVKGEVEYRGSSLLFEGWNSFSRITTVVDAKTEPHMWGPSAVMPRSWAVDQRKMLIDGSASTRMYRFGGNPEEVGFLKYDITNLAYFLPDRTKGAVIGVGGGRDMLSAWSFGLRDITGVEINPIFIRLLTREPGFADYAGLAELEGMRFEVDEARSWFARTDEAFDIIQMSLVDTWAATGAGAFTLSENGLYTVEAWRIFLKRLTPTGVFTASRWYAPGEVNETGRVVSLAVAALFEMGVAEPREHIFLAATPKIATLALSRSPFSETALEALEVAAAQREYRILLSPRTQPASSVLGRIVMAQGRADLEEFTAGLDLDLTPPTDDRPFFFNQLPLNRPSRVIKMALGGSSRGVASGNLQATITLGAILLISIGLVLATIVIPLRHAIRDVGGRLVVGGTGYFFLIGIGFMMIEIGLLQRMSVFLGHPIYSLSVVLFSIILTTGVGSVVSDRFPLDTHLKFATWSVLTTAYMVTLPFWSSDIFLKLDSAQLSIRAAFCVVAIAPGGFLMGFGFPTGMRLVSAISRDPTPWFWGVNGAAGVLASILAVACSIAVGINVSVILGGFCYLLLIPSAATIGFGRPQVVRHET